MTGDVADMAARLRAVLPPRWFADESPVLQAVLQGLGAAWAPIYGLIAFVRAQTRIGSASGEFLDAVSQDFFGATLARRVQETDDAFRTRIRQELLRPRGTRAALIAAVAQLTGRAPVVFEPARSSDTGGYAVGGLGYGAAGGWGNLSLPFQVFLTAYRPAGGGIATVAGYGTGGAFCYGGLRLVQSPVADADILAAISAVLPAASLAWTRIAD